MPPVIVDKPNPAKAARENAALLLIHLGFNDPWNPDFESNVPLVARAFIDAGKPVYILPPLYEIPGYLRPDGTTFRWSDVRERLFPESIILHDEDYGMLAQIMMQDVPQDSQIALGGNQCSRCVVGNGYSLCDRIYFGNNEIDILYYKRDAGFTGEERKAMASIFPGGDAALPLPAEWKIKNQPRSEDRFMRGKIYSWII